MIARTSRAIQGGTINLYYEILGVYFTRNITFVGMRLVTDPHALNFHMTQSNERCIYIKYDVSFSLKLGGYPTIFVIKKLSNNVRPFQLSYVYDGQATRQVCFMTMVWVEFKWHVDALAPSRVPPPA